MSQSGIIAVLLPGSYLLGSLPFGLWTVLRLKGIDIRTVGSGNIGSTNVSRICGSRIGALVFTLDVLKGLLPPLIAARLLPGGASTWPVLAALCAVIGHNYSVWLGFKGGKGVATSLGALLGLAPAVALIDFAVFGLMILGFRMVSLGSVSAAAALPFLMAALFPADRPRLLFAVAASAMTLFKHRANIARLRAGAEPRVRLIGTKPTE